MGSCVVFSIFDNYIFKVEVFIIYSIESNKGLNIDSIINHIKIDENISTSGVPTKKQIKLIAKNGFDVVINLAMHNRGALQEEDKLVTKNGMIYIHIPITWVNPEIKRLKLFLKILKTLQDNNKKVFIHCIMNYRASIFIYQYKKTILKQEGVKLTIPKKFKPNKKWKKIIDMNIRIKR